MTSSAQPGRGDDAADVIDGGELGTVLDTIRAAIATGAASDVPCGTCTACCRSSQFIDVGPDETDALDHIPPALLFPAPGRPPGHRVMGYDADGRCPMLGDHGCTIYEHRPIACRVYDCRIFAVADVDPIDKPLVAARVRRWHFTTAPGAAGRIAEVRAVAVSLAPRAPSPTALAVRAVEVSARRRAPGPR